MIVRNHCLRLLGKEPFYVDIDEVAPFVVDPRPGPALRAQLRADAKVGAGALVAVGV